MHYAVFSVADTIYVMYYGVFSEVDSKGYWYIVNEKYYQYIVSIPVIILYYYITILLGGPLAASAVAPTESFFL